MSESLERRDFSIADREGRILAAHEVAPPEPANQIIVWVHGNTFPSKCEFDLEIEGHSYMAAAATAGFRNLTFDHRGYGASWKPKRYEPIGLNERAEDLSDVVDYLRREFPGHGISLVGLSTGCHVISLVLERQGATEFKRVALMGPLYHVNPFLANWIKKYRRYRLLLFIAGKGGVLYRPFTREKLEERLLTGEEGKIARPTLDVFLRQAFEADPEGPGDRLVSPVMAYPPREWSSDDKSPLFSASAFQLPTLILRGDRDTICTEVDVEALLKDLPDGVGSLAVFDDRKHDFCLYDEHDDTFKALVDFFLPILKERA